MKKSEKKREIKIETIAKMYVKPKMFMDDLAIIHAKFKAFQLKYGMIGLKALQQTLYQDDLL